MNMKNGELQIVASSSIGIVSTKDDFIESRIYTVRGVQVMLDSDLAKIYQVETRVFNQSVKRNENRFPANFRFRLSMEEYRSLISQFVTSKAERVETRGGRQKAPYVFTEQGVAMLDGTDISHLGASLKDLGRKYCAVTKMDAMFISSIMQRI